MPPVSSCYAIPWLGVYSLTLDPESMPPLALEVAGWLSPLLAFVGMGGLSSALEFII